MTDPERILKLQEYYSEHGVLPSYSTIGKLVGYLSKHAVFLFVNRLKESGVLALTPEKRIKPGKMFKVSTSLLETDSQ